MFKNILVLMAAALSAAAIGIFLPFMMSDQTPGIAVNTDALQAQFAQELLDQQAANEEASRLAMLEAEVQLKADLELKWQSYVEEHPEEMTAYLAKVNGADEASAVATDYASDEIEAVVVTEPSEPATSSSEPKQESTESVTVTEVSETIEEDLAEETIELYELESIPAAAESGEITESVVKDAWVNQKIAENRDEIDDADLYSGANIYNQLDTAYLLSLASNGLTEEEEAQVKAYLRENLNEGEIAQVMSLYNKYVHLLQ